MDAAAAMRPSGTCDDARALASAVLDDLPIAELDRRFLRRHLDRCPECAGLVAELETITSLLRSTPLEPFRCKPTGRPGSRPAARVHRAHWATTAAAVVAVSIGVASLPQATSTPAPLDAVVARVDVKPFALGPVKLPIGQRSAESDFAVGHPVLQA